MAAQDRLPARKLDLVIGHVVLAPAAGFWVSALLGFVFGVFQQLFSRDWQSHLFALDGTVFGYMFMHVLLFWPIGILFSFAVALAFWRRRPAAPSMAAGLAFTCVAAFINACFWPTSANASDIGDRHVLGALSPMMAWFGYVLVRTHGAWRPPRPIDWRSTGVRRRLAVAFALAAMIAGCRAPVHYRSQYPGGMTLLWNGETAYFCGGVMSAAERTTFGSAVSHRVGLFRLPSASPARGSTHELVVVRMDPTGLDRRVFVASPAWDATCFIHDGILHAAERGDPTRGVWRWNGHAFEPISTGEAKGIWGGFGPDDNILTLTRRQGWDYLRLNVGHRIPMQLGSIPAEVRFDGDSSVRGLGTRFADVVFKHGSQAEQTVLHLTSEPTFISGAEYGALR